MVLSCTCKLNFIVQKHSPIWQFTVTITKRSIFLFLFTLCFLKKFLFNLRHCSKGWIAKLNQEKDNLSSKVCASLCENLPHKPLFRPNIGKSVNLRSQSEYREIRTRKNSVFGHFSRSVCSVHFEDDDCFDSSSMLQSTLTSDIPSQRRLHPGAIPMKFPHKPVKGRHSSNQRDETL